MTDQHTPLRNAILEAIPLTLSDRAHLADSIATHLLGHGFPASPEDTILVDAELADDPETALDDALTRWGRTALPGHDLAAAVVVAEFREADSGRHIAVAYNPDPEFSPIHAIGLLEAARAAVRS